MKPNEAYNCRRPERFVRRMDHSLPLKIYFWPLLQQFLVLSGLTFLALSVTPEVWLFYSIGVKGVKEMKVDKIPS